MKNVFLFVAIFSMVFVGCNSLSSPTAPKKVQAGFETTISGLDVKFHNSSVGATAYSWDFGDLSPSDHDKDPLHQYTEAGAYIVRLLACPNTNFEGPNCDLDEGRITVSEP